MTSAIFKKFQSILSKSSLTAGIFLRALSNPFFILYLENVFHYLWGYSIFDFIDFCHKDLQIVLVQFYRIIWIKKFRKLFW